ncbi:MAG TPA: hypothetical protein VFB35_00935 [Gaiellaceae bacterium]|nr:hypothetical protein [Gaiellaceae bacterium]
MKDERFDLEGELREGRPRPRAEYVTSLAGDVRGRVRRSRIGMTLALCGLMIVAVASFGGIGYAAGTKPAVAKHDQSSAAAQYGSFTPKQTQAKQVKAKPVKQTHQAAKAEAATLAPKAAPAHTSQLPFTGLALWVPLAIGLVLIAFGVVLRTRARRHGSGAH